MQKSRNASVPHDLEPRKGSPNPRLDEGEFKRRFLNVFKDDAYANRGWMLVGGNIVAGLDGKTAG